MANFEDAILRDIAASRPAAGIAGRLFYDTTNEKWQRDNGSSWEDCEPAGGDVAGPGTSTDNAIARFDGTGGGTIQNSLVTIDDAGAISFPDDVRQTFNPGSNNAGLNVGALAGDPSSPSNGDLWYDSTANELTARINGANVPLGAGGGGGTTRTLAHAFARQINAQTIATASGAVGTIVDFDSVVSDPVSCITTGASWKYTAPRTGLYTISGMVDLNFNSNVYINLYINGVNQGTIGHTPSDSSNARCLFTATVLLNATDYVSIQCLQYSGSDKSTNISAKPPYNSYISIIENPPTILV